MSNIDSVDRKKGGSGRQQRRNQRQHGGSRPSEPMQGEWQTQGRNRQNRPRDSGQSGHGEGDNWQTQGRNRQDRPRRPGPSERSGRPDGGFQGKESFETGSFHDKSEKEQPSKRPSNREDSAVKELTVNDQPRKIAIRTNHLEITLDDYNITAHHYRVEMFADNKRQVKSKQLLRQIWNEFARQNFQKSHPSFDGKHDVYSRHSLSEVGSGLEKNVKIDEDEFLVSIKPAGSVDLSPLKAYFERQKTDELDFPQDAINVINIVMRNRMANGNMIQRGSLFFNPPEGQTISLGNGVEMWHGFFSSAVLGWKFYLNVDVTQKGFAKGGKVIDIMRDDLEYKDISKRIDNTSLLRKFIVNLKVSYGVPGERPYRKIVRDVSREPANELYFLLDNRRITVADYYREKKGLKEGLRYPHLPCLKVGDPKNNTYIPIELCTVIPGQVRDNLSQDQTNKMIKKAVVRPSERERRIQNLEQLANYDDSPYMEDFGITVSKEFKEVEATVLPPPSLQFSKSDNPSDKIVTIEPRAGKWSSDGHPFYVPATLSKWCIVTLDPSVRDQKLDALKQMIIICARDRGMNPQEPSRETEKIRVEMPEYRNRNNTVPLKKELGKTFKDVKKLNIEIVFVIIPLDKNPAVHAAVKEVAEKDYGILTQCLTVKTLGKGKQALKNIILEVNTKLNGINHTLLEQIRPNCLKEPVMIVGADVRHNGKEKPSFAAVTASYDPVALFNYNCIWRKQEAPKNEEKIKEIIGDLENIMVEHLKFFYDKTNGQRPRRIIYLRDGISDSRIPELKRTELVAIQNACKKMQKDDFEPPITFLLAQKRHRTRFFANGNNAPVGTCVDKEVVDNRNKPEFYLQSHEAIGGTARPCKCKVIYDDSDMPEEEIEYLVYYLCFIFARCERSISYPVPTYYAHLAADRVSAYSDEVARSGIYQNFKNEFPMFYI